jgi:thiol-disulfide isomerase/thioredoxin
MNTSGLVLATFLASLFVLCLQATQALAADLGEPVPDCHLDTGEVDLDSYRGQVMLIDFWASWCAPCRKALPFLDSLRHSHHSLGFEIIGINVDKDSDDADRFLDRYPVSFPILHDPAGNCPAAFAVPAMPSSYLVDRDGRLRAIYVGHRDGDAERILRDVTQLLAE